MYICMFVYNYLFAIGGFPRSTLSPLSKEAWWLAGALCDTVRAVYSLWEGMGIVVCVVAVKVSVLDTHVCSKIGVGEFDVNGLKSNIPLITAA